MTEVSPGNPKNQVNFASSARRQPGSTFKTIVLDDRDLPGHQPFDDVSLRAVQVRPDRDRLLRHGSADGMVSADLRPLLRRPDLDRERDAALRQHRLRAAVARRRPREHRGHRVQARGAHRPAHERRRIRPSMGLGSRVVTPIDMASAYSTLAAGGVYSKPMAIRKVVLPGGKVDSEAGWGVPQRKRVDPRLGCRRGHAHPRGEHDGRHRRGAYFGAPLPARPERQTTSPTPGSAASTPVSRRRSGSDIRRERSRCSPCTASRCPARRSRPRSGSSSWSRRSSTRRSRRSSRRRRPRRSGSHKLQYAMSGGYYSPERLRRRRRDDDDPEQRRPGLRPGPGHRPRPP